MSSLQGEIEVNKRQMLGTSEGLRPARIGRLYKGIAEVQRKTGGRESAYFRGFGKAAAQNLSAANGSKIG